MTNTYTVKGMTCNGCRTNVENLLRNCKGVIEVSVNLEKEEASIISIAPISIKTLQRALPSTYLISELKQGYIKNEVDSNTTNRSKFKQLKPLFIIFGYIIITTILLNYNTANWSNAMLDFMGLFFIIFSFFKVLDLKGFPTSFKRYDPLAKAFPVYGYIYPFIEITLGLMFLMKFKLLIALLLTILVLGVTTLGVIKSLCSKKTIECACLGTVLKLPMTEATLIENSIMLVMATYMIITL